MPKFRVLDTYVGPECSRCGANAWMIDSNGPLIQANPQHWLLCMDINMVDCCNTMDLPECVEIIEDEHTFVHTHH